MSAPSGIATRRLHALDEEQIEGLVALLVDCVDGGAGVGFMRPLAPERARAFWRHVADGVDAGERALLVAEDAEGIVGTVQLAPVLPVKSDGFSYFGSPPGYGVAGAGNAVFSVSSFMDTLDPEEVTVEEAVPA